MSLKVKEAILKTVAYSDIFDYPLTIDEIWKYLITDKKISKKQVEEKIKELNRLTCFKNTYYCFKNRKEIIKKRIEREKESKKKLLIAKKAAFYLSFIPSISLIAISGALAMKNAEIKDDIDFFIVTKKGTIWFTRFLTIFLLDILKLRRKRNIKNVSNKICLNMFVDDLNLTLPKKHQDLYAAHELIQLFPLFQRNNMYKKLLKANSWVKDFLPNSIDFKILRYEKEKSLEIFKILNYLILPFEYAFKIIQLWKINKHRTKETIKDGFLAFHPFDYRIEIKKNYNKRLKFISKL